MYQDSADRLFVRRVYFLSGCDRILAFPEWRWTMVDTIAEHIGKTPQEVLEMVVSQFGLDVFERHGENAIDEIRNRLIQWAKGICGRPINAVPDPRIAPRP